MTETKIVRQRLLESQLLANLRSTRVVWTPEVRDGLLLRVELRRVKKQSVEALKWVRLTVRLTRRKIARYNMFSENCHATHHRQRP